MSASSWRPWWVKVAELDSAAEREEFMRGVVPGFKKTPESKHSNLVFGLVAGYLLGKSSQSEDKRGK